MPRARWPDGPEPVHQNRTAVKAPVALLLVWPPKWGGALGLELGLVMLVRINACARAEEVDGD